MMFDPPLHDSSDRPVSRYLEMTPPSLWFWVKAGIGVAVGVLVVAVVAAVLWVVLWGSVFLAWARLVR